MVRGTAAEQERAVARARELGIDFFDTAPAYGNGASETNLGRALKAVGADGVFLSTKFTVTPADRGRIAEAVTSSLEASLRRLGRERVDLLQLHNRIATTGDDRPLDPETVLDEVAPALDRLRQQGKIRFGGITALGDTAALHRVVEARVFDTAQICYNLLNPSADAGAAMPPQPPGGGAPAAQDFAGLLQRARDAGVGTIGIRVLAGGALSGAEERHPLGMPSVAPIASGPDYRADVEHARRFARLVSAGYVDSLVEAALRFVIGNDALSTALIGVSSLEQLEYAVACVEKGPLPRAALDEVAETRRASLGG
jgi:aryl-alcohol dehydrogenase-like predicted oxidoreductase